MEGVRGLPEAGRKGQYDVILYSQRFFFFFFLISGAADMVFGIS